MATIDSSKTLSHVDEVIYEEQWSSVAAGQPINLSWDSTLPAAVPYKVELEATTPPTDGSLVGFNRTSASDSASSRTIRVTPVVPAGGSLTGAILKWRLYWKEQGGIANDTAVV